MQVGLVWCIIGFYQRPNSFLQTGLKIYSWVSSILLQSLYLVSFAAVIGVVTATLLSY